MTRRRIALLSVVGTLGPLLVLTLVQYRPPGTSWGLPFEEQIAIYIRLLVCVPLLIQADDVCLPRLWRTTDNFLAADLVADRVAFTAALARARRAMDGGRHRITMLIAALLVTAIVVGSYPAGRLPGWHAPHDGGLPLFSLAGWWHVLICLPLLFALMLRWLWRLGAWGLLLRRIARCGLRLVAAHPDGAGGLGFLGRSARAFYSVAMAFSAIAAAGSAQLIARGAHLPTPQLRFNIGYGIFLVLLFIAPLSAFIPDLLRTARRGKQMYGAFAQRMGRAFEQRWIDDPARVLTANVFDAPDFSATVDLYSIVASARKVRVLPVGRRDVAELILAVLTPFVPIILMMVPADVILKQMRSLLF